MVTKQLGRAFLGEAMDRITPKQYAEQIASTNENAMAVFTEPPILIIDSGDGILGIEVCGTRSIMCVGRDFTQPIHKFEVVGRVLQQEEQEEQVFTMNLHDANLTIDITVREIMTRGHVYQVDEMESIQNTVQL